MATNVLCPVAKTEVSSEDGLGPPLRSGGPNVLPTDLLPVLTAKSVVSCLSVVPCSLIYSALITLWFCLGEVLLRPWFRYALVVRRKPLAA